MRIQFLRQVHLVFSKIKILQDEVYLKRKIQ